MTLALMNELYPNCTVAIPFLLGNKACDGGVYNSAECGWDGGDCSGEFEIYAFSLCFLIFLLTI